MKANPPLDRCTRCGGPLQMDLVGVTHCRRCVRAAQAAHLQTLFSCGMCAFDAPSGAALQTHDCRQFPLAPTKGERHAPHSA